MLDKESITVLTETKVLRRYIPLPQIDRGRLIRYPHVSPPRRASNSSHKPDLSRPTQGLREIRIPHADSTIRTLHRRHRGEKDWIKNFLCSPELKASSDTSRASVSNGFCIYQNGGPINIQMYFLAGYDTPDAYSRAQDTLPFVDWKGADDPLQGPTSLLSKISVHPSQASG
ncbi:hypothetical protein CIHG_04452 [Coccidioides immitis H538.4]|uniref:Uncharacterized protein n=1 Tax=Coccidioides immitis H538.4 TaxID=396776 RepID=A0A0J8UGY2_COCIT|nr:hypothetical protein CIHG_04452 [Coccidioides immitis H538.4]